jgi:hypothetical protein
MHSCAGVEYVPFTVGCKLLGKAEVYLQQVLNAMRDSLKDIAMKSLKSYAEIDKESCRVRMFKTNIAQRSEQSFIILFYIYSLFLIKFNLINDLL